MHSFNQPFLLLLPCCFILLFCCMSGIIISKRCTRVCLKMLYANIPQRWTMQIVEMIFQTRSGIMEMIFNNFPKFFILSASASIPLRAFFTALSLSFLKINKNGTASSSCDRTGFNLRHIQSIINNGTAYCKEFRSHEAVPKKC